MQAFSNGKYKDTVQRWSLISTGEIETVLEKAIQEQGRGWVLDTILEIQERQDATNKIKTRFAELQQELLDLCVLMQAQGKQHDKIEGEIARASTSVGGGAERLHTARKHQKTTTQRTCFP